jgi:hypothetical protein
MSQATVFYQRFGLPSISLRSGQQVQMRCAGRQAHPQGCQPIRFLFGTGVVMATCDSSLIQGTPCRQHPFSPRIWTNTHFRRRSSNSPWKIRSHVPKTSASPRPELGRTLSRAVESPVGYGGYHLAPHHLPLQVRVGIVPSNCSGQASPVRLCNRPLGRRRR